MEEIVVGMLTKEMGVIVVEDNLKVTAGVEEMKTMLETVEVEAIMFKEAVSVKVIIKEVVNVNIRTVEEVEAMRCVMIGKVVIVVEEKDANFPMKIVEETSKAAEVEKFAEMLVVTMTEAVEEAVEAFPTEVVLGKENVLISKTEAAGEATGAGFHMKRILKQVDG